MARLEAGEIDERLRPNGDAIRKEYGNGDSRRVNDFVLAGRIDAEAAF